MGAMVKLLLGIQLVFTTNFLRDRCFIREELTQKGKRIDVQFIVVNRSIDAIFVFIVTLVLVLIFIFIMDRIVWTSFCCGSVSGI
jgi:hypothetical protein